MQRVPSSTFALLRTPHRALALVGGRTRHGPRPTAHVPRLFAPRATAASPVGPTQPLLRVRVALYRTAARASSPSHSSSSPSGRRRAAAAAAAAAAAGAAAAAAAAAGAM